MATPDAASIASTPAKWADYLAAAPVFAGVPADELAWLASRARARPLDIGEPLIEAGKEVEHMSFVCEGELTTALTDAGASGRTTFHWQAGQVLGLMPYSRLERTTQTILANGPVLVLQWRADELFDELICHHGAIAKALVHQMLDRSRQATRSQEQADRLASLGVLSAGLAHELGNPISAIVSSARQLDQHRKGEPMRIEALAGLGVTAAQITPLLELLNQGCALGRDTTAHRPSALTQRQAESDLQDYLDTLGMADPDEAATEMAQARIRVEQLEQALEELPRAARAPLMDWAVGQLLSDRLIHEVLEATQRVSTLIKDMSTFSRMDRGEGAEEIDLRPGLQTTLRLLDHQVRAQHVEVTHEWPDPATEASGRAALPKVLAQQNLLQVWMNLAKNAIDALGELPEDRPRRLVVRIVAPAPYPAVGVTASQSRPPGIEVQFIDSGPGIPEAIARRIFDPFFTTKAAGNGQGLGLDITRGIVEAHQGWIGFDSPPGGGTTFRVWLPTVS